MSSRETVEALRRLDLAVQADDPQQIVDVITTEKWSSWLTPELFPAAEAALSKVPLALVANDPLLRVQHPLVFAADRVLALSGQTPSTNPGAMKEFTDSGELLVEMLMRRLAADYTGAVAAAEQLSEMMSKEIMQANYGPDSPAPVCLLQMGITYLLAGDTRRAIQTLELARDLAPGSAHAYVYSDACGKLAITFALRGSLDDAQRMLDQSCQASDCPNYTTKFVAATQRTARALIAVARVSDDAETLVAQLPEAADPEEFWALIAYTKARVALNQDRPLDALDVAELAFISRPTPAGSLASELLVSAIADALVASDAVDSAGALLDSADCSAPRIAISRARCLLRQGLYDQAAWVLHELQAEDIAPVERLEAQLLIAELEHANGLAVRPALAQAIAGQVRRGCRCPLTQTPDPIIALISEALPPSERMEFEPATPTEKPELQATRIQLTRGELSVLRALSTNATLNDVALSMHLSRNTVKTHLASVYRKLGVGSKSEALRMVRDLGLVPGEQGPRLPQRKIHPPTTSPGQPGRPTTLGT